MVSVRTIFVNYPTLKGIFFLPITPNILSRFLLFIVFCYALITVTFKFLDSLKIITIKEGENEQDC